MKTNIQIALIVATFLVLFTIGTAVQFYNHSLVGIVSFVFAWGLVVGFLVNILGNKMEAKRAAVVRIRHQ